MSQLPQPPISDRGSSYSPQVLQEALANFTIQQLRQLAIEIREYFKTGGDDGANKVHFDSLKKSIADLKIPGLSAPTILRLCEVRPSHDSKREAYHSLFWGFYKVQKVEIRKSNTPDSTQLQITIGDVQIDPPDLSQLPLRKNVTYSCYCYSIHRAKVFSGILTLSEQKKQATLTVQAQAIDASARSDANLKFEGKWQEGKNRTLHLHMLQKGVHKHRDHIDLIISAGQDTVFSDIKSTAFSLADPTTYFTGTFSSLYTLPADYGSIPSVGLILLKPKTDVVDRETDNQQIHYFLANKVLAAPREDVITTLAASWSTLNTVAGEYIGYYIKSTTSTLHRFRCSIEANGKVTLYLPNQNSVETDAEELKADSQVRKIRGNARVFGKKNSILSLDFSYDRLSGQHRFRLLFTLKDTEDWIWGHKSGLENSEHDEIVASPFAIKRTSDSVEPECFPLFDEEDFERATEEDYQVLLDFFTGVTEPALTESDRVLIPFNAFAGNDQTESTRQPIFTGLFKVFSLERRFIRDKPEDRIKTRRYFIVQYPLRLCEDGTAWMQFSPTSKPVRTDKVEWGENYLTITFQTTLADQQELPSNYTYIHFVFWLEKTDEISKLYGVSIRRGKVPEARVELFLDALPANEMPAETEDGFPFGDIDYEEVKTDTRDAVYNEWMKSTDQEYKANIVNFLSGKLNRLILLHSTATAEGDIQTRQEGHRRIYFYQACYQAQKDQFVPAVESLIMAHRHGFGSNIDDLKYLKEEKELWKKDANLIRIINQLWPDGKVLGD